jgi:pyridoxine 4-dehydrogenase
MRVPPSSVELRPESSAASSLWARSRRIGAFAQTGSYFSARPLCYDSGVPKLGDIPITRIGLGTNRLRHTLEDVAFIRAAVAAGVNHIDTAHLYTGGESEETVGAALAPFPAGCIVATKGGYHPGTGADGLRAEIEESLRRLTTDTIDLYYLHRVHPATPLEDSLAVIREYHDAGRIRHVGISEVDVEQIERARRVVPIAAVQNRYSLAERGHDPEIDHCAAEGIMFVPYFPLRGSDAPAVAAVAVRHGATASQIALAWLLHRSPAMAPIPGTLSLDHLRENLGALEIELSEAEFAGLSAS